MGSAGLTRRGEQRAARAVLAQPRYARYRPSLEQRLFRDALHLLGRLLGDLPGPHGVALLGVVSVLAALLALAVTRQRLKRATRLGRGRDTPATAAARTPAAWRAEAARLYAAGDLTGALRARTRAWVGEVAAGGEVRVAPGLTPAAVAAASAAAHPATRDGLDAAAEVFTEVVYGSRAATEEDYATVAAADRLARHHGTR